MNTNDATNATIHAQIDARMKSLYKVSKNDLKGIVKQSHRVIDISGCDKHSLVSMILDSEFGRAMKTWRNANGMA